MFFANGVGWWLISLPAVKNYLAPAWVGQVIPAAS